MEGLVAVDWQGRRIFLTGHTGFKGSWLSLWLQKRGAVVRGYALEPAASPNLFEAANVSQGMESCIGDIRDLAHLQREITSFQPEFVIHMAAQSLVRLSYTQPVETYATNVMEPFTCSTRCALRPACVLSSLLLRTSVMKTGSGSGPIARTTAWGGYDPYSSSKAAAELVTSSYRNSFFPADRYSTHGVAIASVRAGNVIGGGDWALDRLIPDIMRSFAAGAPVKIRNPHAVRPWQHVLEPLRGYLALAEALYEQGPRFGEGWNFGPRDLEALPVGKIVERMAGLWSALGKPVVEWEQDQQPAAHEAGQLRLDWSKAARELDWQPQFSVDEALSFTVSWYAAWSSGVSMRDFTLGQIAEYEQRAAQQD